MHGLKFLDGLRSCLVGLFRRQDLPLVERQEDIPRCSIELVSIKVASEKKKVLRHLIIQQQWKAGLREWSELLTMFYLEPRNLDKVVQELGRPAWLYGCYLFA
jgi:hypothetical protein